MDAGNQPEEIEATEKDQEIYGEHSSHFNNTDGDRQTYDERQGHVDDGLEMHGGVGRVDVESSASATVGATEEDRETYDERPSHINDHSDLDSGDNSMVTNPAVLPSEAPSQHMDIELEARETPDDDGSFPVNTSTGRPNETRGRPLVEPRDAAHARKLQRDRERYQKRKADRDLEEQSAWHREKNLKSKAANRAKLGEEGYRKRESENGKKGRAAEKARLGVEGYRRLTHERNEKAKIAKQDRACREGEGGDDVSVDEDGDESIKS